MYKINDFNRGTKFMYDIDCNEYSDINLINTGTGFYGNCYDIKVQLVGTFNKHIMNWKYAL